MTVLRTASRTLLALVASLLLPLMSAAAQDYPNRAIRVIVPYPAGGPVDTLARALGDSFGKRNGQGFIVESRPGANTSLGAMACKASDPDGYTICLLASTTLSINPFLYSDLRYTSADLAPITNIGASRAVLMLHNSVPAKNLAELVEWSKKNPEKMNYGSFGVGGETHLMMEWLKNKTGAQITHVPFQGFAPALVAFERGDIQIMVPVSIPPIIDRINNGQAKGIMILSDGRNDNLPAIPSTIELGLPPIGFQTWFGMFAPAGTPKDRIDKMNRELRAIVADKDFSQKFLVGAGLMPVTNSPEEFKAFLAEDYVKAGELVKVSGVKLTP
jgi:tripartite-type tricarboxylate transporter receptor subunit TctC